tara:strand:- start:179 stop:472 length:294 start_codon:yes stop_codon:yes gene_type:complete
MYKNNKIGLSIIIVFCLISCTSGPDEVSKDNNMPNKILIEAKEDDSEINEILDDKDYSYVDWWPVKSESPDNEYKTSTSTIEIKKIPFPKQFDENED